MMQRIRGSAELIAKVSIVIAIALSFFNTIPYALAEEPSSEVLQAANADISFFNCISQLSLEDHFENSNRAFSIVRSSCDVKGYRKRHGAKAVQELMASFHKQARIAKRRKG